MKTLKPVWHLLYLCALFFICYCYGTVNVAAQITFQTPTNGASNIALMPTIKITTHLPIVTSSVSYQYPNLDSNIAHNTTPPTILLIPKMYKDSLPDSLWKYIYTPGEYLFLNDTTLTFTPLPKLLPATEYFIKVTNLKVYNPLSPGHDTIPVSPASITFSTVQPVYKCVGSSAYIPLKNCTDTLTAIFNRRVNSTTPVTLERLISTSIAPDSSITYNTLPVSLQKWIDPIDSLVIYAKPVAPLVAGQQYYFRIAGSLLSGDTLDNKQIPFHVRENYKVNLSAVSADSIHVLPTSITTIPSTGATYYNVGDSLTIAAVAQSTEFVFHHWECEQVPTIHNSSKSVLTIARSCADVADLDITAVYKYKDTVNVTVTDTTGFTVAVYRINHDLTQTYLGGAGTYMLLPDAKLGISAYPNYSHKFGEWYSNDPSINHSSASSLFVSNRGDNIFVKPYPGGGFVAGEEYSLCTDAYIYDGEPNGENSTVDGAPYEDIITLSPNPCYSSGSQSQLIDVSASVIDCYKIYSYEIIGPGQRTWVDVNPPLSSILLQLPTTSPRTTVKFYVYPEQYHSLTVETALETPRDGVLGAQRDYTVYAWQYTRKGERILLGTNETALPIRVYQRPCKQKVELEARYNITEEGFSFVKWHDPVPVFNWVYPSPSTKEKFTVIMNDDKQARGIFKEHFRLRQIGFYRNDNQTTVNWYTTKQLKAITVDDIEIIDNPDIGYGTKLFYKFNDNVDQNSVTTGLSPVSLQATDISDRIDRSTKNIYVSRNGTVTVSGKEIEFQLKSYTTNSKDILKGEEFSLEATNNIKNTLGEKLYNPGTWYAETEMPGVQIKVRRVNVTGTSGDGGLELIAPYNFRLWNSVDPDQYIEGAGQIPNNECYKYMNKGDEHDFNTVVLDVNKAGKYSLLTAGIQALDLDDEDECQDNRFKNTILWSIGIGAAIGGIWGSIEAAIGFKKKDPRRDNTGILFFVIVGGFFIGSFLGALGGALVGWLGTILFGSNEPDPVGTYSWSYPWNGAWFGAHPSVRTELRKEDTVTKYEIEVKLKKGNSSTY